MVRGRSVGNRGEFVEDSVTSRLDHPVGQHLEDGLGNRLLDVGVLRRRAGRRGLEQVVEVRELDELDLRIPGRLQGLLDLAEVLLRRHLQILLAVEGQDGAGDLPQVGPGIVRQEILHPGRPEPGELGFRLLDDLGIVTRLLVRLRLVFFLGPFLREAVVQEGLDLLVQLGPVGLGGDQLHARGEGLDRFLDVGLGHAHRLHDQGILEPEDLPAVQAGAGEQDDEADVLPLGGDHRGD